MLDYNKLLSDISEREGCNGSHWMPPSVGNYSSLLPLLPSYHIRYVRTAAEFKLMNDL